MDEASLLGGEQSARTVSHEGSEPEVYRALRARRSARLIKPTPVSRDLIEQVIAAAAWAPNHHCTEPWRFVVLTGAARDRLGEVMAQSLSERLERRHERHDEIRLRKERQKPLRSPVMIAVAVEPSSDPKVEEKEEIAAGAAAVQNMLLAAEALGLGAMWRTGKPATDPKVRAFLGFRPESHLIAFVYLGYPEELELPAPRRERGARRYTRWMDA